MGHALAKLTGFGLVVATGYANLEGEGRRLNVNRPTESAPGVAARLEVETAAARDVYQAYRRHVTEAAQGPVRFYVEVHGNDRQESAGRVEIATVGDGSRDDAWRLKTLLEMIRDRRLPLEARRAASRRVGGVAGSGDLHRVRGRSIGGPGPRPRSRSTSSCRGWPGPPPRDVHHGARRLPHPVDGPAASAVRADAVLPVFTAAEMRALDARAIRELGIPGPRLMDTRGHRGGRADRPACGSPCPRQRRWRRVRQGQQRRRWLRGRAPAQAAGARVRVFLVAARRGAG